MANTTLTLSHINRKVLLAPVLLGIVVQLYRWWLELRRLRKQRSVETAVPPPWAVATPARANGRLCPPPRPGLDTDERLGNIEDDPRYFQGAELGKAQRAALGQTGLAGQNTHSFDPASTLVRPSMRVLHGLEGEHFGAPLKPDDVILVPDFGCSEEDQTVYWGLADEVDKLGIVGGEDPRKLPLCAQMVQKISTYFGLDQDCVVSLAWHRQGHDPKVVQSRVSSSTQFNCAVSLCFGDSGELHFEGCGQREPLHFPCANGHLVLVARDVDLQWQQPAEPQSHWACAGQFLITVSGASSLFKEEAVLAPKKIAAGVGAHVETGLGRPAMRIMAVRPSLRFSRTVSHDDAIIVPDFFCAEDDWGTYYQLLKEMRENQEQGESSAEWLSWHEGAHLLTKNPKGSKTYHAILDRIREYFAIVRNGEEGTRFNWYRDGSDWKPFHHDSAAFNQQRAALQNCTIGISFGASRELAFRHAKTGELLYFPHTNGALFFFGRDVNIRFQHAINALPLEDQNGKGRISIILWGLCSKTFEEEGSPAMLQQGGGPSRPPSGRPGGNDNRAQVCRQFQQRGSCSFGDRCRFSHASGANGRSW